MAPPTPQRSGHPGKAVAPLVTPTCSRPLAAAGARACGVAARNAKVAQSGTWTGKSAIRAALISGRGSVQLLDQPRPYDHTARRMRTRKITVNVPAHVLENAVKITGKGVTPTVIEGLEELERRAKRSALRALRGKVRFELDLKETRR